MQITNSAIKTVPLLDRYDPNGSPIPRKQGHIAWVAREQNGWAGTQRLGHDKGIRRIPHSCSAQQLTGEASESKADERHLDRTEEPMDRCITGTASCRLRYYYGRNDDLVSAFVRHAKCRCHAHVSAREPEDCPGVED